MADTDSKPGVYVIAVAVSDYEHAGLMIRRATDAAKVKAAMVKAIPEHNLTSEALGAREDREALERLFGRTATDDLRRWLRERSEGS